MRIYWKTKDASTFRCDGQCQKEYRDLVTGKFKKNRLNKLDMVLT